MKKKHIVIIAVLVLVLGLLLCVCAALERKTVPQKEQTNEPGIGAGGEKEDEVSDDTPSTEDNRENPSADTETPATNPPATEPPATESPTTEPSYEAGGENELPR